MRCPTLLAPVYGRVIGSGTAYGTELRFECDDGYKVIGSTERRCQADRSWSGQAARCEGRHDVTVGTLLHIYCIHDSMCDDSS